jgi:threonine aldolase
MGAVNRRRFLEVGGMGAALGVGMPGLAAGAQTAAAATAAGGEDRVVRLSGDGLGLTPSQYARVLARVAEEKGVAADAYILGGVVEELEAAFARALGKERAVFLPTGTLANHLAIRALAGGPSRAVVQAESHIFQDSGDCVQTLSNITLMPLAPGRATFTAADVEQLIAQTRTGRVPPRISVISIETPVRRRTGEVFDAAEMARVVALARRDGIKLHLDGARLFLESGFTGRSVADYAQPFDTVYVSLYKYFNAAGGAILAGPRALLDDLYHVRRMFGGGLYQAWPYAAVALHYLDGFEARYRRAVETARLVFDKLGAIDGVTVRPIASGTNYVRVTVTRTDAVALQRRLASRGILVSTPSSDGTFLLGVNESWLRLSAAELVDTFTRALTT